MLARVYLLSVLNGARDCCDPTALGFEGTKQLGQRLLSLSPRNLPDQRGGARDNPVHFWPLSQGRGLLSTAAGKTGKPELTNTYMRLGNVSGVCTLGHTQLSQEQPHLSCVWEFTIHNVGGLHPI